MNTAASPEHTPKKSGPAEGSFSRDAWLKLFVSGQYEKLNDEFLRMLDYFIKTLYYGLTAETREMVNSFVENFLYFFCHPGFTITPQRIEQYLSRHPLIANIVAMSDFKTTTPWVLQLSRRKESYFKLLILYNVKTEIDINPTVFFNINSFFGSEWWTYFWLSAPAFCTREAHERIRRHLKDLDDRFVIFGANARASYFPVTYVAPESEKVIKARLNRLAAEAFAKVSIRNRPDRKKIALASGRWYRSAVYSSLAPLVNSLKGHYAITLIHYGDEKKVMDQDLFEKTTCIQMKNSQMDLAALQDNEFSAVIYPDIGMNSESIYLSNIRIAPVQIMMYGHPASTWGSAIDYFIGGQKVEDLAHAQDNYGERLVVIPGMGVYPVYPDEFTPPPGPVSDDPLIINCGWTAQKVTYPLLCALQDILARARRKIVFQLFPGGAVVARNGFIPFAKDVFSMISGENIHISKNLPRQDYLAKLCEGTFSLDSYPFGGFNTVIDALYCKKPIVVWETGRAYSRFGSATLELTGMRELIARSREEYVEKTVRMINDDGFRREMIEKVAAIDLKAAFAKHENPEYFRKAVDFLIENHERLKAEGSREPIIIE
jgi:hypothetical protein